MAEIVSLDVDDADNIARFPELQAPGTVNNGARALEGMVARWEKDTNGSLNTAGGTTAYTLAVNRTTAVAVQGEEFVAKVNATNTGAVTINITPSGGAARGAVAVQKGGLALVAGEWKIGDFVRIRYDGTQFQMVGAPFVIGVDLLATVTLSTQATANFTAFNNAVYSSYFWVFERVTVATDDTYLLMRISTDGGATYKSGASDYQYVSYGILATGDGTAALDTVIGDSAHTGILIATLTGAAGIGNAANEGVNGKVDLPGAGLTSTYGLVFSDFAFLGPTTLLRRTFSAGSYQATTAIDAVRFLAGSGNLVAGKIKMYGRK